MQKISTTSVFGNKRQVRLALALLGAAGLSAGVIVVTEQHPYPPALIDSLKLIKDVENKIVEYLPVQCIATPDGNADPYKIENFVTIKEPEDFAALAHCNVLKGNIKIFKHGFSSGIIKLPPNWQRIEGSLYITGGSSQILESLNFSKLQVVVGDFRVRSDNIKNVKAPNLRHVGNEFTVLTSPGPNWGEDDITQFAFPKLASVGYFIELDINTGPARLEFSGFPKLESVGGGSIPIFDNSSVHHDRGVIILNIHRSNQMDPIDFSSLQNAFIAADPYHHLPDAPMQMKFGNLKGELTSTDEHYRVKNGMLCHSNLEYNSRGYGSVTELGQIQ
eukprot:gene310-1120_t